MAYVLSDDARRRFVPGEGGPRLSRRGGSSGRTIDRHRRVCAVDEFYEIAAEGQCKLRLMARHRRQPRRELEVVGQERRDSQRPVCVEADRQNFTVACELLGHEPHGVQVHPNALKVDHRDFELEAQDGDQRLPSHQTLG